MKKIFFFNHYHNGDLFASREFIKEIVNSLDVEFIYGHYNHPLVLSDLNVQYADVPQIPHKMRFLDTPEIFYINTWIGSYITDKESEEIVCTLKFSYDMFSEIYSEINKIFNSNLKLSSMENYFPSVDFSKFKTSSIDEYVAQDLNKKVLLCNGPCRSGQCVYEGDMSPIIESLSTKYPNITFICTQEIFSNNPNVKFTGDIINAPGCDLNEIGYLSKFCDLIIGRNSGPHCFSAHKENVKNPNKIFYAFGQDPKVSLYYNVDLDCRFVYEVFESLEQLEFSISELISELQCQ